MPFYIWGTQGKVPRTIRQRLANVRVNDTVNLDALLDLLADKVAKTEKPLSAIGW